MWEYITVSGIVAILLCFPPKNKILYRKASRYDKLKNRGKNQFSRISIIFAYHCLDEKLFTQWLTEGAQLKVIHNEELPVFNLLKQKFPNFSYQIIEIAQEKPIYPKYIVFDYPPMLWIEGKKSCTRFSRDAEFIGIGKAEHDGRHCRLKTHFNNETTKEKLRKEGYHFSAAMSSHQPGIEAQKGPRTES